MKKKSTKKKAESISDGFNISNARLAELVGMSLDGLYSRLVEVGLLDWDTADFTRNKKFLNVSGRYQGEGLACTNLNLDDLLRMKPLVLELYWSRRGVAVVRRMLADLNAPSAARIYELLVRAAIAEADAVPAENAPVPEDRASWLQPEGAVRCVLVKGGSAGKDSK